MRSNLEESNIPLLAKVAISICALAVIAVYLHWCANQDERREELAQCVAKVAIANHYPLPHSEEAWKLFASLCYH